MFIRFVSAEIHSDSQLAAGLFCAAYHLRNSETLPDYESDGLTRLLGWFDLHMSSPFEYLLDDRRHASAICWFKPAATEHIARAWELVGILDRNDILIWTIKSPRVGYIHYEDEVQVLARPYREVRLLL